MRSSSGFTLVEVLISVSLLALVALVLVGTFFLSRRAMEKARFHSIKTQEFRSATEILAGYIRSAFPYRFSSGDQAVFFLGSSNNLHFVSALSLGLGGRGMSEIQLSLEEEPGNLLVLRERLPLRVGAGSDGEGHTRALTLMRGIRELRISYLDPQKGEDLWLEVWDARQTPRLPRAVKINFLDDEGKEIRWVFPIMMSVISTTGR